MNSDYNWRHELCRYLLNIAIIGGCGLLCLWAVVDIASMAIAVYTLGEDRILPFVLLGGVAFVIIPTAWVYEVYDPDFHTSKLTDRLARLSEDVWWAVTIASVFCALLTVIVWVYVTHVHQRNVEVQNGELVRVGTETLESGSHVPFVYAAVQQYAVLPESIHFPRFRVFLEDDPGHGGVLFEFEVRVYFDEDAFEFFGAADTAVLDKKITSLNPMEPHDPFHEMLVEGLKAFLLPSLLQMHTEDGGHKLLKDQGAALMHFQKLMGEKPPPWARRIDVGSVNVVSAIAR